MIWEYNLLLKIERLYRHQGLSLSHLVWHDAENGESSTSEMMQPARNKSM